MEIKVFNDPRDYQSPEKLLEVIHELSRLRRENFEGYPPHFNSLYLKQSLYALQEQMENDYAKLIQNKYENVSTDELKSMRSAEEKENGKSKYYDELDFEICERERVTSKEGMEKLICKSE